MQYHIVYNGVKYPIDAKTVLWTDAPQWAAPKANKKTSKKKRKIKRFVNHWDVCKSSKVCLDVMNRKGLSCHFLINEAGIIIQTMDLNDRGFHAKYDNYSTAGVEINNPYHLSKQRKYNPRPVMKGVQVHGEVLDDYLFFHPVQIESLKALWKAVHDATGIPLECPVDENEKDILTVVKDIKKFEGFISHFHIPRKDGKQKKDCAGLDLKDLLSQIS